MLSQRVKKPKSGLTAGASTVLFACFLLFTDRFQKSSGSFRRMNNSYGGGGQKKNDSGWLSWLLISLLCTSVVTFFAVLRDLRLTPSVLMRPKAPKTGCLSIVNPRAIAY